MTRKLSQTLMLALAVVLVTVPLAFAQQTGSSSRTTESSTTHSSSMGTMGAQDAIHATVADVDHQKHTVKLHMQSGETVELKVPEQSLASLSKGDSVQVSIHKAAMEQSNMPSSQQPSGATGSTGTRSR